MIADRINVAISVLGLCVLCGITAYELGRQDAPVKVVERYRAERFCASLSPTELRRMAGAKERLGKIK